MKAQLHTCVIQDSEHFNCTLPVMSNGKHATKQLACMHGLLSVHGAVVVNEHAKRLISGSFPDVVIFLPFGTWTAHSHSICNLREKKADTLNITPYTQYIVATNSFSFAYNYLLTSSGAAKSWSHRHSPCRCDATAATINSKIS